MDDCIFCKIGAGEIPAATLYEDDHTLAFLDIAPAAKGHALVIPKAHCESLHDADFATLQRCLVTAQKVAAALRAWGADGVNLLQNNGPAAGQVVMHLHFHLFPRYEGDGRAWGWKGAPYPEGEMERVQREIAAHLV